jgi:hypothetical protein
MAQPARKRSASPSAARAGKTAAEPNRRRKAGIHQSAMPVVGAIPTPDVAEMIGEIRIAAGPAFSAATRLKVAGMNTAIEKEKHSITLDKPIVEQIRELFGARPLSASINDLLQSALVQHRLGLLVDQMEEEAGPASPEAFDRVFSQWFEEE